jgi:hypothetical protein
MRNRLALLALLPALAMNARAGAGDPAGYALLDKFVVQFEQMARQGTNGAPIGAALEDMMSMARRARDEKRVDTAFFDRYTRLLRVFKLVTMKDPEGILHPTVEREVEDLVGEVLGAKTADITSLARAMTQELDNLRKSLDGS